MLQSQNPLQIPAGETVLVAGDGASRRDFATELAADHRVYLATGKKPFLRINRRLR
jgi:cation diffusion facilitator CzcD-associated flavoprotein CzcO